ncbi:MAG: magnesium transporter CorA [Actinomycetia bacterium]|jgi:magnesium transporter|nr:magnesium transporter CorA [Actinomycetes bacterium]
MEVHVVRDGAIQSADVSLSDLRSAVSDLDDGEWVWVDAVDPDHDDVAEIQRQLDLHDLAVEDVRHRNQRPKLDLYPGHAFAVFRPLAVGPDGLSGSELFVFVAPRFLITLRFAPAFDLAKAKLRWPIVCTLAPGTASALYAIADEIVDDYLEVVEELEGRADELENQVFRSDPEPQHAEAGPELQLEILRLRRDAVQLRRHAVPMRQLIDRLADDSDLITAPLVPYLRDITDHLLRTIELTDGVREILTTVVDIRMAQSAHQLNEVMKKLTAWAAIILVPTLVAGIYGMNFRHMPELRWVVGYPLALGLMAVSCVWLYLGFRKRGWL